MVSNIENAQEEDNRLKTLKALKILDTPPEERFDRLTRMAKRMFRVPIAIVSLSDENRQWFKSRAGIDAQEIPREGSFCGHAILGDDVFVVPDATQDPRFAESALVLDEPHIHFYAGCPLRALDGSKLGTLCIIDQQPRTFDEDDAATLVDLASMVESEFAAIQIATVDELTNITNRRGFLLLAEHSLNLCVRQKISILLVFMDLDKFKFINDTFGHAEGDRALSIFAQQMQATFRESDIFGRLGGDEFVVLLTNATKESTEDVIARFQRSLDQYTQEANLSYQISFSHGVVELDVSEDAAKELTIEALLDTADKLMYELKKEKKANLQSKH